MENTENVAGRYNHINNTLTDEDDFADAQDQNVSISVGSHGVRPGRAAVLCLVVLCVVLFTVDVSLGIYYSQMDDGIPKSSGGLKTIFHVYTIALEKRDKMIKQLANERRQLGVTRWELEHQKRRSRDYNTQIDTVLKENAGLQSQVSLMTVDCGHCLPGWIHIASKCFYLAESTVARRSWQEARNNCKRKGADLAIVDSSVKQSSLNMHIEDRSDANAPTHVTGYWIGLSDEDVEGTWTWLNGESLVEGYWKEGEPNNSYNEDCAANYPGVNPFSTWNDAPCSYSLKWICEMTPQATSPDL